MFRLATMLLITATLFAVQIKTDFHANKIVVNIFGAQERPNTDKIRYEYGKVSTCSRLQWVLDKTSS